MQITGAPLRRAEAGSQLTLYVAKADDLVFVSSPFVLSSTHIALATSATLFLVGLIFTWNWTLRKQVSLRTKSLKKITSHLRMSFDSIKEALLFD